MPFSKRRKKVMNEIAKKPTKKLPVKVISELIIFVKLTSLTISKSPDFNPSTRNPGEFSVRFLSNRNNSNDLTG
jgi:hypothetical protein